MAMGMGSGRRRTTRASCLGRDVRAFLLSRYFLSAFCVIFFLLFSVIFLLFSLLYSWMGLLSILCATTVSYLLRLADMCTSRRRISVSITLSVSSSSWSHLHPLRVSTTMLLLATYAHPIDITPSLRLVQAERLVKGVGIVVFAGCICTVRE